MTSRDFCFWLQGYFEIRDVAGTTPLPSLNAQQVDTIRNHLNLVFVHEIDPSIAGDPAKLQAVHDGSTEPTNEPFISMAQQSTP